MSRFITRSILLAVLCAALLAVFAGPAAAVTTGGGHWTWQSPLPSGGYLSDTSFIGSEGWAATGSPDVLHTTDGGVTWQTQATGEDDSLYAVEFISATEGWAAGDWGCVLHTTDGGATWTRQASGTLDTIIQIDFTDADHGWLVGYSSVTATSDGGDTWVVRLGGESAFYEWWYGWYGTGVSYEAVAFTDAQHGVVVGSKALQRQAEDYAGVVWTTADGGATWTETQVEGVTGFAAVSAEDGRYYAVGSDNAIAHTDDGVTWKRDTESANVSLYDIDMTPGGGGWAVGYGDASDWYFYSNLNVGILLHTTDGGATWTPVADPVFGADTLVDVTFADADNGYIVGSSGAIYVTSDGGATWAAVGPKRPPAASFLDITESPDGLLWVVGSTGSSYYEESGGTGVVWRSDDDGATWEDAGNDLTAYAGLSQVYAAAGGEAWVAGEGGRILHTTDGGATWKQQATGIGGTISGITFTDATHGWAISAGLRGVVLKTTDGGAHWVLTRVANLERFMAIAAEGNDIWLGGMAYRSECEEHGSGVVLHSADGGTTWTSVTAAERAILQISVPAGTEAWALSGVPYWMEASQLLHSADAGATWAPVELRKFGVSEITSLWFADADEGWLLGRGDYYGAIVLHTVDGGQHWGALSIPETWDLRALAFAGTEDGWVVGGASTILATTDGGGMAPISLSNADGHVQWVHKAFTLKVTTVDDGLGLAPTQMRVGDGAWEDRSSIVVGAPASHANDGYHVFRYRGVDLGGNKGAARTVLVAVDTRPPSVTAHDKAKARSMRRGSLRLKAHDSFSPWVRVFLDAYDSSGKRVTRMRSSALADGQWHPVRYNCRLKPGHYRLVVSVKDIAGNPGSRTRTLTLSVTK